MIVEQRPGKRGSGAFGYLGVRAFWAEETAGAKALRLVQRNGTSCRINHCI